MRSPPEPPAARRSSSALTIVDACLRQPPHVRDLGLDLEALLVHRVQLLEGAIGDPFEIRGVEDHVDAPASRL